MGAGGALGYMGDKRPHGHSGGPNARGEYDVSDEADEADGVGSGADDSGPSMDWRAMMQSQMQRGGSAKMDSTGLDEDDLYIGPQTLAAGKGAGGDHNYYISGAKYVDDDEEDDEDDLGSSKEPDDGYSRGKDAKSWGARG